jgi:hypothetical protein
MYLYLRRRKLLGLSVVLLLGMQTAKAQQSGDENQPNKLPTNEILVKGAWSSASDPVTPLPEGGILTGSIYTNKYFGITYTLPPGWVQKYSGPPPSSSGYYVLAQIRPSDTKMGTSWGSILIAAQDLFFTLTPAANALELIKHTENNLPTDYKTDQTPTIVTIAQHPFVRFDYHSPVAGLHWYVLATQIRCHMVQFVFTSRDTKLIEALIQNMNGMNLPPGAGPTSGTGGDDVPVCIKDYARGDNVTHKVDPYFTERRFNAIPVRIVIGKDGRIKHIHFLSAFPDQAKSISDALSQWRFKPYLHNGQLAEVETGILFGYGPPRATSPAEAGNQR